MEECLSIPGICGRVMRPEKVVVNALYERLQKVTILTL
jgi:peptide deformylase